jgi:hypothetical protein
MTWPTLPRMGFIVGRPATADDVARGSAVFCQQSDDAQQSEPLDVEVPQYAIWHGADEAEVPAILVQAEHHITDPDGDAVFGLRTLDGREVVASGSEVSLLGEQVPTASPNVRFPPSCGHSSCRQAGRMTDLSKTYLKRVFTGLFAAAIIGVAVVGACNTIRAITAGFPLLSRWDDASPTQILSCWLCLEFGRGGLGSWP